MKVCIHCQRNLPLAAYPRHPAAKDGHGSSCKDCRHEYQRQQRIEKASKYADPLVNQFNQMVWPC